LLAAVAAPTVGFWKYFALWNFFFNLYPANVENRVS
jgi:hypothetical protein